MPPDFVLQYLPLEFVGVVMAIAAAAWGVRVILDVNKRVRAWAQPWIAWIHRFRASWDGTPEVRDSGGNIVHHATPGVPARLDGYDQKFVGFTNALAEGADDRRDQKDQIAAIVEALGEVQYNVKSNSGHSAHDAVMEGQKELRELVSAAMREIGELHANHPNYSPRGCPDRFTD